MTCCVEDIRFAAFMGIYDKSMTSKNGLGFGVKAKVRVDICDIPREKDDPALL